MKITWIVISALLTFYNCISAMIFFNQEHTILGIISIVLAIVSVNLGIISIFWYSRNEAKTEYIELSEEDFKRFDEIIAEILKEKEGDE